MDKAGKLLGQGGRDKTHRVSLKSSNLLGLNIDVDGKQAILRPISAEDIPGVAELEAVRLISMAFHLCHTF